METNTNGPVSTCWLRLLREPSHDPALNLPPYLTIMFGERGKDGSTERFFSKDCAIELLELLLEDGCDTDMVAAIVIEIMTSDLPKEPTQADLFFTRDNVDDSDDGMFARIIGVSPGQEGSGKARYALRTGDPDGSPMCGALFVNGIALAARQPHFSQERALEQIEDAFADGLMSDAERKVVVAQMRAVGLPEKLSQLDRIVQTKDIAYARFLLGVDPPAVGSGHAAIRTCGADGSHHAHLYVRGRAEHGGTLYTKADASSEIDAMYEKGYFSDAEVAVLKQELASLDLPAV